MNLKGNYGKMLRRAAGIITVAAMSYGCAGGANLGSLSGNYSASEKPRLEAMASSKKASEKRAGLKGLCQLVDNKVVDKGTSTEITNFVYGKLDQSASMVAVYPVGKMNVVGTGAIRSVGNDNYTIKVSWEKAKKTFANAKDRIMEACAKMGTGHVRTTTPSEAEAHKARISQKEFEALVKGQDVMRGKSWEEVLQGNTFEAANGGYTIHIGFD